MHQTHAKLIFTLYLPDLSFADMYSTAVSINSTPLAGDTLELKCIPGDDGRPNTNLVYTWLKNGVAIKLNLQKYLIEDDGKLIIKVRFGWKYIKLMDWLRSRKEISCYLYHSIISSHFMLNIFIYTRNAMCWSCFFMMNEVHMALRQQNYIYW